MGILSFQTFFVSSSTKLEISVAIYPGETEFARANLTHSTASDLPELSASLVNDFFKLTEMDHSRLSCVVRGLHLREVDNMSAHGCRSDEAAISKVGQFLPIEVGTVFLLSPPVCSGSASAVEGAVQVAVHYCGIVLDRAVNHRPFSPGNSGIGNKDIQTAIEFLDNGVDADPDGIGVGDITLVSLSYARSAQNSFATRNTSLERRIFELSPQPASCSLRWNCRTWQRWPRLPRGHERRQARYQHQNH